MNRLELEHVVAVTAVALYEHDIECRDYACLMRDGCPLRIDLMGKHNEAVCDLVELDG